MAGLLSLLSGQGLSSKKVAQVLIAPLDLDGKVDEELGGAKVLQYWPETMSESKSQNWQSKEMPGLNSPLYQWIGGGERQFSFTANFSRDMDGEIGNDSGDDFKEDKHNVDIDAAIAWLYLLSSSDYEARDDMIVAVAPPILFISLIGTNLGYNDKMQSMSSSGDISGVSGSGVHCILTSVSVERKAWFPSGHTRSADVSLTFNESIQHGANLYPYGRDKLKAIASKYTRRTA